MKIYRYDVLRQKMMMFSSPRPPVLVPEYIIDGNTIAVGVTGDKREQRKTLSQFRRLHKWNFAIVHARLQTATIFTRTHSHEWIITIQEVDGPSQGMPWSEVPSEERKVIRLRTARDEMRVHFEKTGKPLQKQETYAYRNLR